SGARNREWPDPAPPVAARTARDSAFIPCFGGTHLYDRIVHARWRLKLELRRDRGCPWGNGSHADTAEQRGHRRGGYVPRRAAPPCPRSALFPPGTPPATAPRGGSGPGMNDARGRISRAPALTRPATAPRGGSGPGMNDARCTFRRVAGHERC